jgi:hypothetical protein
VTDRPRRPEQDGEGENVGEGALEQTVAEAVGRTRWEGNPGIGHVAKHYLKF